MPTCTGTAKSLFVPDEDWGSCISNMTLSGTYGDHLVLDALTNLLHMEIVIITSAAVANPISIIVPHDKEIRLQPLLIGHK
jgi:hypothetical protein